MARRRSQAEGVAGSGAGSPTPCRIEGGSYTVRDIPERLRPREEMRRRGAEHVSDDVLIAVLLRSGVSGRNVISMARELLRDYGSLTALAAAGIDELAGRPGMGPVKALVLKAALETGRRLNEESTPERQSVKSPADAAGILGPVARPLETEVFWVLLLDAKNRLKRGPVEITRGLLDASLVHPREVFREAISAAAAAVVLVHNHPSGDPTPSAEDLKISRQLVQAGAIVDIRVLDHVVLGRPGSRASSSFVSLREEGMVDFG